MKDETHSLELQTDRLVLRVLNEEAAPSVAAYYSRNRLFHQPWFPARDDTCFTIRQQQMNLSAEQADFLAGRAIPFWMFLKTDPQRIIGRLAVTQIVMGSLRSACLAWHLDQSWQGQGLAFEAGQACIGRLFAAFGLHRIEAAILPDNKRSIALAGRLGFELEGIMPRYLQINGVWSDHLRYVRLADGPLWAAHNGSADRYRRLAHELTHLASDQHGDDDKGA